MPITKNKQPEQTICQMAATAFPDKKIKTITELTEGMCNAAYMVEFTDTTQSVLKIAPLDGRGLMSNEVNLMDAEVTAMRIIQENQIVKVAKVQYYDTSNKICASPYFFMEVLEGQSYFSIKDNFTDEENRRIHYEIGQTERKITAIPGKYFGLLGDTANHDTNLFDFVYRLIKNVLSDAERRQVAIGVSSDEILARLLRDKEIFAEVTQPVLVHWDMWEGNVFVKDKHVCGIIDWERAMWADPFLDDRFRRHTRNADFLKGYGKKTFTFNEMRRIYWYDIFLYLTMMTEGAYREYEDDSQYQWVKPFFEDSWKELQCIKEIEQ